MAVVSWRSYWRLKNNRHPYVSVERFVLDRGVIIAFALLKRLPTSFGGVAGWIRVLLTSRSWGARVGYGGLGCRPGSVELRAVRVPCRTLDASFSKGFWNRLGSFGSSEGNGNSTASWQQFGKRSCNALKMSSNLKVSSNPFWPYSFYLAQRIQNSVRNPLSHLSSFQLNT